MDPGWRSSVSPTTESRCGKTFPEMPRTTRKTFRNSPDSVPPYYAEWWVKRGNATPRVNISDSLSITYEDSLPDKAASGPPRQHDEISQTADTVDEEIIFLD